MTLYKNALINQYAEVAGCTKKEALNVLKNVTKLIETVLADGNAIHIHGYMEMGVKDHHAWSGTHPLTQEPMDYPAYKTAYCKFGDAITRILNGE